ncbi:MAG: ester cyclase [Anaerolineales bacterium]|jgi:predicted ester cyclase
MSREEREQIVRVLVEGINRGDLGVIDNFISRDFFNYSPPPGEDTAPQVIRRIVGDLQTALPDLTIAVDDFVDHDDTLNFNMTMSGTHRNDLWGAPGSGNYFSWTSTVTSRFTDGKFSFEWRQLAIRDILGTFRQLNLVPAPEDMDKPHEHPVSIPEFILKLLFTGQVKDKYCAHLDLIKVVDTEIDVCQDCVDLGDFWPALRMCLICGYIGCCDTSKNKHMKQHYQETGHSIFRSIRLDESWVWCYEDDAFFSGKILDKYR